MGPVKSESVESQRAMVSVSAIVPFARASSRGGRLVASPLESLASVVSIQRARSAASIRRRTTPRSESLSGGTQALELSGWSNKVRPEALYQASISAADASRGRKPESSSTSRVSVARGPRYAARCDS